MRALDDDTYPHTAPLLLRAPPPTRALTIYYITILTPPTNLCAFLSQLFCIFSVVMDRRRSRFHHEEILVSGDSPWEAATTRTNRAERIHGTNNRSKSRRRSSHIKLSGTGHIHRLLQDHSFLNIPRVSVAASRRHVDASLDLFTRKSPRSWRDLSEKRALSARRLFFVDGGSIN